MTPTARNLVSSHRRVPRPLVLLVLLLSAGLWLTACDDNPVDASRDAPQTAEADSPNVDAPEAAPLSNEGTLSASSSPTSTRDPIPVCGDSPTSSEKCLRSETSTPISDGGITPELWNDNPNCEAIGFGFGFKIEGQGAGDYTGTFAFTASDGILTGGALSDPTNSVTLTSPDGTFLDWSATLGIDAVIMKGGSNANAYVYVPEATADGGLATPEAGPALSHVEFCYDYELSIEKTAVPELTRTYEWSITKDPDASYVGFPGDTFPHTYDISVDRTGFTDSDWAVTGTITVENNTPVEATVEGVSDEISGVGPVAVECGVSFPTPLAAGEALQCTYASDLPDGQDRTNTATVETSGALGGAQATAPILFANAVIHEVNGTVNVTDDNATPNDPNDDRSFGPFSGAAAASYDRTFECPVGEGAYTNGVYTASFTNRATINETGDFDEATVDVTCYLPATAQVVKSTTEGNEDIGQFPFTFELYDPSGTLIETATLGTGGGTVAFTTDIETEGTWTVQEVLPTGWVSTTDQTCTFAVAFPGSADQTYTCTFGNVEKSRVDVKKLTNGLPTTSQTWTFALYEGPDGFGTSPVATDATPPALLDFGSANLDPFGTYTLCELEVPAGYSTFWQVDTDGDGTGDVTVLPYNPNADDNPPEDLGNRCVDVGAGTALALAPGTTLHFVVDNQAPGGAPRTPGYWKNWNRCTNGGQQYTADANGGYAEGFWLLEDVLDPAIGGGIVWDDIQADNLVVPIASCKDAVLILDKRDLDGKKQASDPLHNLATHLLATQLNFGAGACTTQDVLDWALAAENLLDTYNFDGYGHDPLKKKDPDAQTANELAEWLDRYNNGAYCP